MTRREKMRIHDKAWRSRNPEKVREKNRRWAKNNPERKRLNALRSRLMVLYGLSLEKFEGLFEAQQGRCAICKREQKLFVDHNHTTKKVRALLCARCNFGIGHFSESPELLRFAADYLEQHACV